MKTKYLILVLAFFIVGAVAYFVVSPDHREPAEPTAMDDRPPLAHTDNEREFLVVLEVSGNELTARYDNHVDPLASDVLAVKLNTSEPGFTDALSDWLHALGPERLQALREGNNVKIRVGKDVSDDLVKQIAGVLQVAGITEYAVTNC